MKELTKQQQLIIEEIKILISLHINKLQQYGMTKEEAIEKTQKEVDYILKKK